ncbi:MAG TPA: prepilin-type N-terminal cleavage/methylation domain-containing protein [Albitalea sp.]
MSPRAASRRARGFTLVEVMVALLVMSLLAVMAWQGVDGIVRTREVSQARLEQTLRLTTVIGQLEHDLQALQETTAVPGLTFDGATLRLTRRAEDGLQVVTWSMRPDADATGHTWMRWASPPLRTSTELQETWLQTQQFQGAEPGQLRTLSGIARWQVFCWRGNAITNCQSTGDVRTVVPVIPAAPAASAASAPAGGAAPPVPPQAVRQELPSGVRLVLDFAGGELTGTLTRDIAIGP